MPQTEHETQMTTPVEPEDIRSSTDEEETSVALAEDDEEIPHLPDPSIWPLVIALGISTLLLGIAVHLYVMIAGLIIFAFGLGGWIYQDIQVARRGEHH
jgi:hypothetical protein